MLAVFCASASFKSKSAKSAPSCASLVAMARPMPVAAPVTRATFPFKLYIFMCPSLKNSLSSQGVCGRDRTHRPKACAADDDVGVFVAVHFPHCGLCHCAVIPPSTISIEPVEKDDSSLARNRKALAISSGRPSRFIACRASSSRRSSCGRSLLRMMSSK